jgi:hypothetical protein
MLKRHVLHRSSFRRRQVDDGPVRHGRSVLASAGATFGGIIGFIIWILIMIWIYNIAKRKGRHALGWLILGFFFSIITLIVLLVLPSKRTTDSRSR